MRINRFRSMDGVLLLPTLSFTFFAFPQPFLKLDFWPPKSYKPIALKASKQIERID